MLFGALACLALAGRGDQRLDGGKHFPWSNLLVGSLPDHSVYHSTDAIHAEIENLTRSCGGALKYEDDTAQFRGSNETRVLRLTNPNVTVSKTPILITLGIHGREYIAGEVSLAFLRQLCDGSDRSKTVLDTTDFLVFPVLNVAGRKKMGSALAGSGSVTCSSMRKNANEVDLNRNFDVDWESGSTNEDEEDYRGPSPASEPEIKLLVGLAKRFGPKLYIDVHSGDETMMYPYSYKAVDAENWLNQSALATFAAKKVWGDSCEAGSSPAVGCPVIGNAAVRCPRLGRVARIARQDAGRPASHRQRVCVTCV